MASVRSVVRQAAASIAVGGVAATMSSAMAAAPRLGQLRPPASPEHDADVHAPAGDRRDSDVAIVEHAHPGIVRAGRLRISEVVGQADAWPQARSSPDAGRRGDDRPQAIGADDDIRPELARRPVVPPQLELADGRVVVRHGPAPLHLRAGPLCHRQQGGIERRAIEADGRLAAGLRAVGQPKGRPTGCLDAHGRDRTRDGAEGRLIQAHPAQGDDCGGRREDAGGPPPPLPGPARGRGPRVPAGPAEPPRRRLPARRPRSRPRPARPSLADTPRIPQLTVVDLRARDRRDRIALAE